MLLLPSTRAQVAEQGRRRAPRRASNPRKHFGHYWRGTTLSRDFTKTLYALPFLLQLRRNPAARSKMRKNASLCTLLYRKETWSIGERWRGRSVCEGEITSVQREEARRRSLSFRQGVRSSASTSLRRDRQSEHTCICDRFYRSAYSLREALMSCEEARLGQRAQRGVVRKLRTHD